MAAKFGIEKGTFLLARQIPKGSVSTYGAIALALGNKNLARIVGNALGKNQNPWEIPCHRVVLTDGRIGGYRWGAERKARLLKREGVIVRCGRIIDFNKRLFTKFKKR
jgi:O-6-methylguanine DNA methyltransferase